jgi:hypothetical protein
VKSQLNEIEATSYVWPFYSRTKGPGLERFRVFPFYGYSDKKGVGRKTFVMWPFWNQVRYTLPKSRGTGWILFPLLGHLKLTDQETWWFLPPIFRYTIGEEQNRLFGPWPIIQKGEGEVDKFYIFPLYGRKQHAGIDSRFLLWPIGHLAAFFPFVQGEWAYTAHRVFGSESTAGGTDRTKLCPVLADVCAYPGAGSRGYGSIVGVVPVRGPGRRISISEPVPGIFLE